MLKVLIVDDEAVVRRGIMLGMDWAAMGCVVVGEASNGEEGIAAVERYSPNLIITDVRMPRMDGIEMLGRLREMGCRAHVILLTAHSDLRPLGPPAGGGRLPAQALPGPGAGQRHRQGAAEGAGADGSDRAGRSASGQGG